jgi:hypothetical protein
MPVDDEDRGTEGAAGAEDDIGDARGSITFIDPVPATEGGQGGSESAEPPASEADDDLFASEERRAVLVSILEDAVDGFLSALADWEIGARRGRTAEDGMVEILIHASNVPDAQAVLVEHFGDVRLVEDIAPSDDDDLVGTGGDAEALDNGYELLITTSLRDVGPQGNRLRDAGIDVRVEIRDRDDPSTAACAIFVPAADIERAREILGIEA